MNHAATELIIGIDLGTTNSEVAIISNGQVTLLDCEPNSQVLPSIVGLDDHQTLLVGTPAKNQYALHPQRTIKSIKRQMGEAIKVNLGEQDYTPQEISAMILSQLKQAAQKALGKTVSKAVITVPAYFSDVQRQATRDAGEIAGLEVVRIINEPTAAALAYQMDDDQDRKVLVYDLGGGTFDVSIVSQAQGVVEVLASHGNNRLGGDDFDQKLVAAIYHQLEQQSIDIQGDPRAIARIEKAAEQAKIALSNQPYVTIEAEYITSDAHLSFEFSRHDYEQLITPYIDETLNAIHTALDGAQLSASDIDEVILVGGSSRTPLVHQRLKEVFGMVPRGDINPDLCVASGAAIVAGTIAGDTISPVLVDITPYSFGTSAVDELDGLQYGHCYCPLIDKYTPLPVSKSDVFFTMAYGQSAVDVEVFQGEDEDALQNIKIGEFMITGLDPEAPPGNPIIINLNIDINGILKVTAQEKNSGLSKSITIDNALSNFEQDQLETAKERVQSFFAQPESTDEQDKHHEPLPSGALSHQQSVQAQTLIEKAKRLLDDANSDDRDDLIDISETLQDALNGHNSAALAQASEQMSELIYFLES